LVLVGVGAGLIGAFGFGLLDVDGIHNQIKQKVCEIGLQKFKDSQTDINEQLEKVILSAFSSEMQFADTAIKHLISSYENLLEQQEKAHQQNLQEREVEKRSIAQKRQELEQVQKEIAALLTQATA
jgi:dimeric dUTPase (all-alpha-NTP-PPase superfamily)